MEYDKKVALVKRIVEIFAEEKVTIREVEIVCGDIKAAVLRSEVQKVAADKWDGYTW